MKVNLACGDKPFPKPWWNVDLRDRPGVDQTADLLAGVPDNIKDVEMLFMSHFLEHITPEEGVKFLSELRSRMTPGGTLITVGPDVDKAADWYKRGLIPLSLYEHVGVYNEIDPNDPHNRLEIHVWDCTGQKVTELLEEAGWSAAEHPIASIKKLVPELPAIDQSGWQCLNTATL